jgi:hypothetical protein
VRDFSFPRVCRSKWFRPRGPHSLGPSYCFFVGPLSDLALYSAASSQTLSREPRHVVPAPPWSQPAPLKTTFPIPPNIFAFGSETKLRVKTAHTSLRVLFNCECCSLELLRKKMSGRWGDRPLGRGGWRVLQPEVSSQLPRAPLRSRAAERHRSKQAKPSYSGSRNQLPITVAILPSALSFVDSPTGSFYSVLPGTLPGLYLVPTYLRRPFVASLTLIKLLEMRKPWKRRS